MKNINFGCKVTIKFNELCKFKDKTEVLRNVTEIHFNYPSLLNSIKVKGIAFESNIHQTGVTYILGDIDEFETELENKKQKEF